MSSLADAQRAGMLIVAQLNRWGSGVDTWIGAISTALWTALLTDRGVASVSLDGDRLLLLRPGETPC